MAITVGAGLARIIVAAPQRRLDVALPEHVPLALLLPALLTRAGDGLAGQDMQDGGWVLRRGDGTALDPAQTLLAQGVRDGQVLHLAPRRQEWPELEYDDVVEAIAGARSRGPAWSATATRACGLGLAALGVLVVLVLLARGAQLDRWMSGILALVLALLLLAAGVALGRAFADADAGSLLAAAALPAAFLGGLLILADDGPLTGLGAPHLLLACTMLFGSAVLGLLGVVARGALFVAAAVAGAGGAGTAALALTPLESVQSAAVTAAALLVLGPVLPLLAVRAGRMPMPALPRTADDLVRDEEPPRAAQVRAAVLRADRFFTGILIGVALVTGVCLALLIGSDGLAAPVFAAVVSGAYLLRARLFTAVAHRTPLIVLGAGGLTGLVVVRTSQAEPVLQLAVLLVLLAVAAVAVAAGLRYSARPPSVYLGRLADVVEVLLVLSVVPVACAVLGLYAAMRALIG